MILSTAHQQYTNFLPFILLVFLAVFSKSEVSNNDPPVSRVLPTSIQHPENPWYIPQPDITWDNFKLNFDFEINDEFPLESVWVQTYRDGQCTRTQELAQPNSGLQLRYNQNQNDVPLGDGTGRRPFNFWFIIDPYEAWEQGLIFMSGEERTLTFCMTVSLYDPNFPSEPPLSVWQDSFHVKMKVPPEETDLGSIVAVDAKSSTDWGVDIFRCNHTNLPMEDPEPILQGQPVRLCMTRTNETIEAGLYLAPITSFIFQRGDINQEALLENQQNGDGGLTRVDCVKGSTLCVIETYLSNDFFTSAGTIAGSGSMWLQFAFEDRMLREPSSSRSLYRKGEYVKQVSLDISIDVEPNSQRYMAEAFRCNFLNEESQEIVEIVDTVRICFRPNQEAREAGCFMRSLNSFTFRRGGFTQEAVTAGGIPAQDGNTMLICSPGDALCSSKTRLGDGFFASGGVAEASGEIILQFGSEKGGLPTKVPIRFLQEGIEESNSQAAQEDPGFAGITYVTLGLPVILASKNSWWSTSPFVVKCLYVVGIAMAVILLCGLCSCLVILHRKRKRARDILHEMGIIDKVHDDSVDALMASHSSLDSNLGLAAAYESDYSSEEESNVGYFEDEDLEERVAHLFPRDDVSYTSSNTRGHQRPPGGGLSASEHGYPNPRGGISNSEHGAPRRGSRGPGRGDFNGPGQGRGRGHGPGNGLSASEHGPTRTLPPPPRPNFIGLGRGGQGGPRNGPIRAGQSGGYGGGRGLSVSEHGRPARRGSNGPGPRSHGLDNSCHSTGRRRGHGNRPSFGMDSSQHSQGRRGLDGSLQHSPGRARPNNGMDYSCHSTGRRRGMDNSQHSPGRRGLDGSGHRSPGRPRPNNGMDNSSHSTGRRRGTSGTRSSFGMDNSQHSHGSSPGRHPRGGGLSSSDPFPRTSSFTPNATIRKAPKGTGLGYPTERGTPNRERGDYHTARNHGDQMPAYRRPIEATNVVERTVYMPPPQKHQPQKHPPKHVEAKNVVERVVYMPPQKHQPQKHQPQQNRKIKLIRGQSQRQTFQ